MVLRHFNLREQPFGVTPDPRFLYATATHREALAALLYGIESGLGFVSLIANPGMGKTTILFEALGRLEDTVRTVFLFQSIQTPIDLFRALLIDLGEKNPPASVVDLETRLNEILLEHSKAGKKLVVVLDEAQNLDFAVLEAVRMLSNFETPSRKLVQIILCGQLQLADRLAQPDLLQLRQRISIFASLDSLPTNEVIQYIQHRLKVTGYGSAKSLFTNDALGMIARHSGGIPRNINNICFNALTIGCALGKQTLDAEIIREVIDDLNVQKVKRREPVAIAESIQERTGIKPPKRKVHPGLRVAAIAAVLFVVSVGACVLVLASSGNAGTDKIHRDATDSTHPPSIDADLQKSAPVQTPQQMPIQTAIVDQAKVTPPTEPENAKGSNPAPPLHANNDARKKRGDVAHGSSGDCGGQVRPCGSAQTPLTDQSVNRILEFNPLVPDPQHVKQGNTITMSGAATSPEVSGGVPPGR